MKPSLAGHNILIIDSKVKQAQALLDGLKLLGANVVMALTAKDAILMQKQWDTDVVLAEVSSVTAMGDQFIVTPDRFTGKAPPLVFAYGSGKTLGPAIMGKRGILQVFSLPFDFDANASVIKSFLYDPREHVKELLDQGQQKVISLKLQNGAGSWDLDVNDFSSEGMLAAVKGTETAPEGELGVLVTLIPDQSGEIIQRFSVRIERNNKDSGSLKIKILPKDQTRWLDFLNMLDKKQQQITSFLVASSGR